MIKDFDKNKVEVMDFWFKWSLSYSIRKRYCHCTGISSML